jgi:hypothetical protein
VNKVKCEFYMECPNYHRDNKTCNTGGSSYCGTYRKLSKTRIVYALNKETLKIIKVETHQ